jgi:NMT1/THI5 like protein
MDALGIVPDWPCGGGLGPVLLGKRRKVEQARMRHVSIRVRSARCDCQTGLRTRYNAGMNCRLPLPIVVALVACLGLAAATAAPARAASEILFGITSSTAFSLPHYIAEEKKYYAAENLAVTTYVVGAASGVLQQLAGGSLNMAQAATDQTLRAILRGAPIRIVAGASSNAPFRVVAARNLKHTRLKREPTAPPSPRACRAGA